MGIFSMERAPLVGGGRFGKVKELAKKAGDKAKMIAEKREFCVVLFWFATCLPWFHTVR